MIFIEDSFATRPIAYDLFVEIKERAALTGVQEAGRRNWNSPRARPICGARSRSISADGNCSASSIMRNQRLLAFAAAMVQGG